MPYTRQLRSMYGQLRSKKYAIMRITFALRVRVPTFVSLSSGGTLICDVNELKVD